MKKILSLVLVLAMALCLFAGCGSKDKKLIILDTEYAVEDYALAVKKGNQELLDNINAALEKLTADGTIDEIIAKYIKAE